MNEMFRDFPKKIAQQAWKRIDDFLGEHDQGFVHELVQNAKAAIKQTTDSATEQLLQQLQVVPAMIADCAPRFRDWRETIQNFVELLEFLNAGHGDGMIPAEVLEELFPKQNGESAILQKAKTLVAKIDNLKIDNLNVENHAYAKKQIQNCIDALKRPASEGREEYCRMKIKDMKAELKSHFVTSFEETIDEAMKDVELTFLGQDTVNEWLHVKVFSPDGKVDETAGNADAISKLGEWVSFLQRMQKLLDDLDETGNVAAKHLASLKTWNLATESMHRVPTPS
tara:strand:- start:4 stop:852 length:849 start_codon:yes stop_codon:yes gene_type:complete